MALTPIAFTQAFINAGPDFLGPAFFSLTTGLGLALYTWVISPTNIYLTGATVGTAGSGVVTGTLLHTPQIPLITGVFTSMGIAGPTGINLARVIALGLSVALAQGQYTGVSVGVSSGTDISAVSFVNPATLSALLSANLPAAGLAGLSAVLLIPALSASIAQAILLTTTLPGSGIIVPTVPIAGPATGITPLSNIF